MDVKIYTSDTCSYCHLAKEYLDKNNVEYIERNVSKDKEAKRELIAKGYMGVPVIIIDGEAIQGFKREKIDELLKIARS